MEGDGEKGGAKQAGVSCMRVVFYFKPRGFTLVPQAHSYLSGR